MASKSARLDASNTRTIRSEDADTSRSRPEREPVTAKSAETDEWKNTF